MTRVRSLLAAAVAAACLMLQAPAALAYEEGETQVFYALDGALQRVFPDADEIQKEEIRLDSERRQRIEAKLERPLEEESFTVHIGKRQGQVVGYAIVTEEIGRFHPITFLVRVDPDGRVADTLILVYRESRGGEVRHKRFLAQFKGKKSSDPVQLNRDVINITGATLSVRAVARGIQKVLAVVNEYYLKR